ncbi:hypothetical protein MJO52_05680 [Microbulbifer variabilis]|uniref:Lipoprotein n=1 Tax=Microbulbifer variabilis TaxID=266805 RepID=A0ABY4VJJ2_9GAMM|nr:hypothetical protein [Microbulbifer variabilis]USD22622.1 hypothetical protein MJO52_05680 [Microbulbifer variabilis]
MHYLILPLALVFALSGCDRKGEPHKAQSSGSEVTTGQTASEAMKQPIKRNASSTAEDPTNQLQATASGSETICTPGWFTWVQRQVMAQQDGDLKKMYPSGLPPIGSAEWFDAITKLTGGNLADVKPGSPEWCLAVQKRLSHPGDQGL